MESYAWFTLLSAFSEQREEAAGLPAAPDIVGAWLSSYSTCTDLKPTYLAANQSSAYFGVGLEQHSIDRSPCISTCESLYLYFSQLSVSHTCLATSYNQVDVKPILAKTSKHLRKIGDAQKEDPKVLSARLEGCPVLG